VFKPGLCIYSWLTACNVGIIVGVMGITCRAQSYLCVEHPVQLQRLFLFALSVSDALELYGMQRQFLSSLSNSASYIVFVRSLVSRANRCVRVSPSGPLSSSRNQP
jgi:hypothetical protein